MELLTVFLGAAAGVMIGSAAVSAIKNVSKKKRALDELEDATNKARKMLANLAGEMQEALEPEEKKDGNGETH
jgi:tryptophan synthase alpha subunit